MMDAFAVAGGFTTHEYLQIQDSRISCLHVVIDHYRRSLLPVTCRRFADSNSHTTKILDTFNSPASQGYFKEMYYVLEDQQQTLQSAYLSSTSERQSF
ncbi:hypothetical protein DPMN_083028 [Dreissena polymorpha]|uniref:Uncharacterized protein n=1 Tax=Dreissena polymorpha TaxID=45954 RepID=A0A9D3YBV4_DREPO|nr:hypothetical protein DPMN_083028 [Dreissena polymorpha]